MPRSFSVVALRLAGVTPSTPIGFFPQWQIRYLFGPAGGAAKKVCIPGGFWVPKASSDIAADGRPLQVEAVQPIAVFNSAVSTKKQPRPGSLFGVRFSRAETRFLEWILSNPRACGVGSWGLFNFFFFSRETERTRLSRRNRRGAPVRLGKPTASEPRPPQTSRWRGFFGNEAIKTVLCHPLQVFSCASPVERFAHKRLKPAKPAPLPPAPPRASNSKQISDARRPWPNETDRLARVRLPVTYGGEHKHANSAKTF